MTKVQLEQKVALQQKTIKTLWGMIRCSEYEIEELKAKLKEKNGEHIKNISGEAK